jgi:hypothetical protein
MMQAITLNKNENKGSQMEHTKEKKRRSFFASTKILNFSIFVLGRWLQNNDTAFKSRR